MNKVSHQKCITAKQIALLHVAKKQLSLLDEDYLEILQRFGNCENTNELTHNAFELVINHLNRLGFRSTWSKRNYGQRKDMTTVAQINLIRSLWKIYTGADDVNSDQKLDQWLSHYHQISALRFVNNDKAKKVIPALKEMANRKQK